MSDDALNPAALSRMRIHEPPPEDFDPYTAPQELLRRHGLPRRPDPDREPDLAWLWKRAMARPPIFVKAELAIDPVMSGRDSTGRRKPEFDGPNGFDGQSNWAGIERDRKPASDYTESATCVLTQLRVPHVYDLTPDRMLAIAFWAGIDLDPILQAGVVAVVDPGGIFGGGGVSYRVWTEWFPIPPVYVSNFPISSGDSLLILVSADQPDVGNAFFHNLSTGMATSVDITAPPNVTKSGGTVEWTVEAVTEYLPLFNTVNFDNCIAGTPHGVFYPMPPDRITNLEGNPPPAQEFGPDYTQTFIASQDIVLVRQIATNWF